MNDKLKILIVKKEQLDKLRPLPPELLKNLEDWFRVELTYSSNAIEGNTLSRIETAEVIEKGLGAVIGGKPLKDQLEAVNHAKALEFIKELAKKRQDHQFISEHNNPPFMAEMNRIRRGKKIPRPLGRGRFITEADILAIHKIILTGIDDNWAGKYRQTQVFIQGTDVELPPAPQVPTLMASFIHWLEGQQEEHPARIAADAHFKFVSIHPFLDGNGRTARLLMNLILILNGYPMAVIRMEERVAYLSAIYKAQKQNEMQSFYDLIEKAVEDALNIYLKAAQGKTVFPVKKPASKLLRIGELAALTGETIATLRFWTKEGLLKVKDYTKGGYQLYEPAMVERVEKIRRWQKEKRLTIKEISMRH